MTIAATATGIDRYSIKYYLVHDGGTGQGDDDLTIANVTILADMVAGPLKELWDQTYADTAAARAALSYDEHVEMIATPINNSAAGLAAWSFHVGVDASPGRPTLNVRGSPDPAGYLLQLNYRHSTGR